MSWWILVGSGVLEAVWATALAASDGLRRPRPTALFLLSLAASMVGLAIAMRTLPAGTAYAVWVGIGASGTVALAMLRGDQARDLRTALWLLALVGCVVGLKVVA